MASSSDTAGETALEGRPDDGDDRDRWVAWAVGLVAAVAVVGPGLAPGAWMNVDLLITPTTPVPGGVWGLGPELPRRIPFILPFAWLSSIVPGELPLKLAVVVALASTVAGTWRLVGRWDPAAPRLARLAAGLLLGVGPFAVTRAGVGHLGLTFALAVLPWALPTLLRPADHVPRTALWALALGLCGPFGGTLALPVVVVGLVASGAGWRARRGDGWRALAVSVGAQALWLVPTLTVALLGTNVGSAGDFPTDSAGAGGLSRLLAGHGFWLPASQIGSEQGWEAPVAGLVLTGLAVVGLRSVPRLVRSAAVAVAVLGLVGAVASALPGADGAFAWLTERSVFAAVREGQRLLALYLVVAVPTAALGAARLARATRGLAADVLVAVPLAATLVLVAPGLWGAAGGLDPVTLPGGWHQVRSEVRAQPGTVLVVPWRSYPLLPLDGGRRRVLNPMPIYLGGDVLASSDPGFDDASRERSDPREPLAESLAARLLAGDQPADELADLGVRWVVELRVNGEAMGRVRGTDTLQTVVATDDIALHRVSGWAPGRLVASGEAVDVGRPVGPLVTGAEGRVRVAGPGSGGWWRGTRRARTVDGLLELPGGSGPAVYPAAVAVLAADALALGLAVWAWRRRAVPVRGRDRVSSGA